MDSIVELKEMIEEAECVLVGIGEDFSVSDNKVEIIRKAYEILETYLKGKNYFIVSLCDDGTIFESGLLNSYISAPNYEDVKEGENSSWDKYLKWFSCTLNRKLLVIELGVSMLAPQVIRWPFEKAVMINNKAKMVRVNELIPNVPAEISDKSITIKKNALDFLVVE